MVMKDRWTMCAGLRRASALVAIVALGIGGAKTVDGHTLPGSGFSTVATVAAEPTGPPGPTGGMTEGGGSQFQPPQMPSSMPDYQGGNNQPPLDQNSGISIYNTGSPGAQQVPGQLSGQQPQQGWDQPAHGTQMPNYSTAPGYTQGPGQPNPDYQAPQQQAPQQGQQSPQQGNQGNQNQQPQQPNQNQQSQEPHQQNQQDQGDQQRQQKCEGIQQDMAIDSAMQLLDTVGQVADVAQQIAQIAEMILPKGGGGGLGPDGSRQPGRLPITPFECSICPPDKPVKPKPDPKPDNQPAMTPDTKPDNKPVPTQKNEPEPTKKPDDKSSDDPQSMPEELCDVMKTPLGSIVCEGVKRMICTPGQSDCEGQVPVCFQKGNTAPTAEEIAQREQYIDAGNKFIKRNQDKGGQVIRRVSTTQSLNGRKTREITAAKNAATGADAEAYKNGAVGGHMPDLVWEGTKDDNRDVKPMSGSLNSAIGGQSNAYKWGYVVTAFVRGVRAISNGVDRCIAEPVLR
ncbi:Hypothetical protein ERS075557_01155 [Mycobacteroides abscessus]|nr:Hypothetical protein ERS075557_01155 [Mycobacteroides abscessus]